MPRRVTRLGAAQLDRLVPVLVDLLIELVNSGASLGFVPPAGELDCRNYWLAVRTEVQSGSRLLFGAWVEDRLAGSCQLALPRWPNALHRAEVNKVMVASRFQGQGIGRSMLDAVHRAARRRGRSLILLNTRRGDRAEQFYRSLGYQEAGVVPGYSLGPEGVPYDNVMMYRRLGGEMEIGDQRSEVRRQADRPTGLDFLPIPDP